MRNGGPPMPWGGKSGRYALCRSKKEPAMNKQQAGTLMQERRPGALNRATELQRNNPGWSWLKCCSRAKLEWEQNRSPSLPNTTDEPPKVGSI
jgi:hypothetical protein